MSSLNHFIIYHFQHKAYKLQKIIKFNKEDLIIDIVSNDETFYLCLRKASQARFGVNTTTIKYKNSYEKYYLVAKGAYYLIVMKKMHYITN